MKKTALLRWLVAGITILALPAFAQKDDKKAEKEAPAEKEKEKEKEESKDKKTEEEKEEPKEPAAGHSAHGAAFSEGPRQEAVLLGGTGNVHFEVTTKSDEAQKFFDQGVGQLHGFWAFEAERSFRQVLKLDPDCAMAYWGIAMANVGNAERAKKIIAEAKKRVDSVDEREKMYINALSDFYEKKKKDDKDKKKRARNLVRAYEAIVTKYPDDIEAKAFLCYQIWHNSSRSGVEISSHLSTDLVAREVLRKNPMHPVHHYLIHLWDYEKPENAIDSAARCGQTSPTIAHMWHMPGHTFSRVKRYADAAWQQEASARVDHAHMVRYRVMPDRTHNYAHNNGWCVDNYAFLGRIGDALDLSTNMIELPRVPRSKKVKDKPDQQLSGSNDSYANGRRRLMKILLSFELWDKVLELKDTPYLEANEELDEQLKRDHLIAMAHLGKGNSEEAAKLITSIDKRRAAFKADRQKASDDAETKARDEKKNDDDINKAMAEAMKPFTKKISDVDRYLAELKLWQHVHKGEIDEAKEQFKKVKKIPDDKKAVMHLALGEKDKAEEQAKKMVDRSKNQVRPLATYVHVLATLDKKDEAKKQFEKLRTVAAHSDMDIPVLTRLAPLAAEFGFPENWRNAPEQKSDAGERPSLDSLGPLRWRPSPAPNWSLADAEGNQHSLSAQSGKPHILIFFLGKGCSHCMEQLNAFAPEHQKFVDAGLPIYAISTDDAAGLKETLATGEDDAKSAFPFPLLTDAGLDTFKAWDAYDDFEGQALHGTFLIDANGLVRWQHISYEPFMRPEFLLEEAERLLNFPEEIAAPRVAAKPTTEDSPKVN